MQQREAQLEIDRMQMAAEDELSMKAEIFNHKQKFAQKDEFPPVLPKVFTDIGWGGFDVGPLSYKALQPTPRAGEPAKDNYARFELKLRLPQQIDLTKVKVIWSKEKETAEQEAQRKAEAARRKEEKRQRLTKLAKFSKTSAQQAKAEVFKKPAGNVQQAM